MSLGQARSPGEGLSIATGATQKQRFASIDTLRGLVMAIMALDHVRDMLTQPQASLALADAVDFSGTNGALFFTRWVTHICAPTFILLAGVSAYLYGAKGRPRAELARFLLSRGAWLVVMELTLINFAWNFNLGQQMILGLQVIWAIGCSMIALAGLIWLPRVASAVVGLGMVVAHNLLDGIQPLAQDASPLWLLLHVQGALSTSGPFVFVVYPLIPWIGVMALGYAAGPYCLPGRSERLVRIGALLTLAFFILRIPNLYGEPSRWILSESTTATLISFFNTTKYPPSLQFLLMTLGPALMLLGWFERTGGPVAAALETLGRVPFFYYVAHLYVIHATAVVIGLVQGFALDRIAVMFLVYPPGFGLPLGVVYLLWGMTLLVMYPVCRWFAGVKARRKEWWMSYL